MYWSSHEEVVKDKGGGNQLLEIEDIAQVLATRSLANKAASWLSDRWMGSAWRTRSIIVGEACNNGMLLD
jgi:hypothetical protein